MGIIKPDAIRVVVNSIGNLVYYQRAGINCVRSKSTVPYTSNTPAQQLQHSKFRDMGQLASTMKFVAELGFPQRKRGLSASNAFHKANKECCLGEEGEEPMIDYEHLQCSKGPLFPPLVTVAINLETRAVNIDSEAMPADSNCNPNDAVYVAILDKKNRLCRLVKISERGEEGTLSVNLPKYWSIEYLEMYAFAVTKDGKYASNSLYVTV